MRKIPLLLILIMVPQVSAQTLSVSDADGEVGATVEVPITLSEASNIGSMDIIVRYNPEVLSLGTVDKGVLASKAMFKHAVKEPGLLRIGVVDASGINGDGTIAVLKFNILDDVGAATPVEILTASANDATTIQEISVETKDGIFSVIAKAQEPQQEKKGICGPTLILLALIPFLWMMGRK
jgi:hypothetical protein